MKETINIKGTENSGRLCDLIDHYYYVSIIVTLQVQPMREFLYTLVVHTVYSISHRASYFPFLTEDIHLLACRNTGKERG